ncbi:transcriptional regulator, GntR family [Cupriavidus sp. YR651]|uniref:MocR-like pyridoxine biosynthesis transcription factor PdxR n=1 Tax=Cupriavidus sp. YR651 TaxID=1855315 RepID=UPI00088C6C5F|nr:PLP-dependent aminotransferase family protein [Cupriavidus sp. YR651]SDD98468.1 transcriptional regulator, GntR family [Cupriavidus sp. YR651]
MQRHSFSLPIAIARDGPEPFKRQIMRQVEGLVVSGRLQPGDRLPSIACLIAMLHVSRNTVVGAYDGLIDAGLLRGESGRGFYVADATPRASTPVAPEPMTAAEASPPSGLTEYAAAVAPPGVHAAPPSSPVSFDFKIGRPAPDAFPARRWAALANPLLCQMGHAISDYPQAQGLWGLRVQISDYLAATRAMGVDPEQIVIVAGVQEALHLLASHLVHHRHRVVVEAPGYAGFCNLPPLKHASQVPVPVDEQGLCTSALPDVSVQLAYTTPSHQYPLGYTMSMSRRRALLAWAARVGACVIEDDYDGDFSYDGPLLPPLMALDPGRVVYVGSFSKVLGPGLRLGFMVCPPVLTEAISRRKALLNHGCPWLEQAVLARLLECGDYSRHLYRLRQRYRLQRDTLLDGLRDIWGNDCQINGTGTGMHISLRLPDDGPDAAALANRAIACGVRLYPLADAACGHIPKTADRTLLLGYASQSVDQIRGAMARLRLVVAS